MNTTLQSCFSALFEYKTEQAKIIKDAVITSDDCLFNLDEVKSMLSPFCNHFSETVKEVLSDELRFVKKDSRVSCQIKNLQVTKDTELVKIRRDKQ